MPRSQPKTAADVTHVLVRLANGAVKSFPVDHPATSAEGVEVLPDRDATDLHGDAVRTKYPVVKQAAEPKPEEAK